MGKCIFCDIIEGKAPATIINEDKHTITFFDIRPLFPGHCLVVPKKHIVTLPDIDKDLLEPLMLKVQEIAAALPNALGCQGTFVAMNNIVSQSVPHLHVHVVPRTKGDGLKGFFWPRKDYKDDLHKGQVAEAIKSVLQ